MIEVEENHQKKDFNDDKYNLNHLITSYKEQYEKLRDKNDITEEMETIKSMINMDNSFYNYSFGDEDQIDQEEQDLVDAFYVNPDEVDGGIDEGDDPEPTREELQFKEETSRYQRGEFRTSRERKLDSGNNLVSQNGSLVGEDVQMKKESSNGIVVNKDNQGCLLI